MTKDLFLRGEKMVAGTRWNLYLQAFSLKAFCTLRRYYLISVIGRSAIARGHNAYRLSRVIIHKGLMVLMTNN